MTTVTPASLARPYTVDPHDPRAPPTHVWSAMTEAERRRIVEALPSDFTLDFLPPPEGDRHFNPKAAARDTLGRHFKRVGRRVYVSGELPIYYPGERVFSADLIAVLDVEVHERDRWVVDLEGKGIDFALEIHVRGNRRKDMTKNVERYAQLGIREYFVFDRARGDLHGFRLAPKGGGYERLSPRQGRLESAVLGLDLSLAGSKLLFLLGDAAVPDADELLARLGATLDDVMASKEEAERRAEELEQQLEEEQKRREEEQKRREEEQKRREEEQKRREEEQKRREDLERELAAARAELDRLRRGS